MSLPVFLSALSLPIICSITCVVKKLPTWTSEVQNMSDYQATAACDTSVPVQLPFSCPPPFFLHFIKFCLFRNERERRIWVSCSYLLVCNAIYGHEQSFFKFNFVFIENRLFSLTVHPDHSSSSLLFKISPNLLHLHFAQKRASLQEMTTEQDKIRHSKTRQVR